MTKLFTLSVRERPASLQTICTREKLYSCDECRSLSTQSGNLKKNIKIHTGENLFTYRKYGNAFTLSSSLSRHQQIHMEERSSIQGDRQYIWNQCEKTFTQKGTLVCHMLVQAGDKPHWGKECKALSGKGWTWCTVKTFMTGNKLTDYAAADWDTQVQTLV